ncbi:hypothetical protein DL769_011465 [Monosporascus sp. CRB-8-3]|nr:hypothetical protein DL769_011465 [Monosporascus sp. CRB-8-3]
MPLSGIVSIPTTVPRSDQQYMKVISAVVTLFASTALVTPHPGYQRDVTLRGSESGDCEGSEVPNPLCPFGSFRNAANQGEMDASQSRKRTAMAYDSPRAAKHHAGMYGPGAGLPSRDCVSEQSAVSDKEHNAKLEALMRSVTRHLQAQVRQVYVNDPEQQMSLDMRAHDQPEWA